MKSQILSASTAAGETSFTETPDQPLKPNGAPIAALVSAGIGAFIFGLLIILSEASPHFLKPALTLSNDVGPLSGKTVFAVIAYALSWLILAASMGRRHVNERAWTYIAFALLLAGFIMTFPPFYQIFTVAP